VIPRRGSGAFSDLFVHDVIKFVKELSLIQDQNGWITLDVYAGDGIWVLFKGKKMFLILPAKSYLRVIFEESEDTKALVKGLKHAAKTGTAANATRETEYLTWHVRASGFEVITDFLKAVPELTPETSLRDSSHPRYFPGELRQLALQVFERGGRMCPGVDGKAKRHKIDLSKDRVEFDHVFPFSKGGASSSGNIQVLCKACNNLKRATAL
jgi:hypothetical protein